MTITTIATYIPVTRRKNIHRVTYGDTGEQSHHQTLDKVFAEVWERGRRVLVIEDEKWRYFVSIEKRETKD